MATPAESNEQSQNVHARPPMVDKQVVARTAVAATVAVAKERRLAQTAKAF
jgi:hypothetical protein